MILYVESDSLIIYLATYDEQNRNSNLTELCYFARGYANQIKYCRYYETVQVIEFIHKKKKFHIFEE